MEHYKTNTIIDFLTFLDIFGQKYTPTFDHQRKFKSLIGSALSLLTVITSVVFVYILGKEVIEKQKPKEILRTTVNPLNRNTTFNMSLGMTIEDRFGKPMKEYEKMFNFKASLLDYRVNLLRNGTFNSEINETVLTPIPCKKSFFPAETHANYDLASLDAGYCLENSTHNIFGYWGDDRFRYLTVSLEYCLNETRNSEGLYCMTDREIYEVLNVRHDFQVALYYDTILYNAKNNSSPVSKTLQKDFYRIDPISCKTNEYYIQNWNISTDDGIIFDDDITNYYQQIDAKKYDLYTVRNWEIRCIVEINFFASDRSTHISRYYLKVQEVIAQLGGLLNIIYITINAFLYILYCREMDEHMVTRIFNIYHEDVDMYERNEGNFREQVKLNKLKKLQNSSKIGISDRRHSFRSRGVLHPLQSVREEENNHNYKSDDVEPRGQGYQSGPSMKENKFNLELQQIQGGNNPDSRKAHLNGESLTDNLYSTDRIRLGISSLPKDFKNEKIKIKATNDRQADLETPEENKTDRYNTEGQNLKSKGVTFENKPRFGRFKAGKQHRKYQEGKYYSAVDQLCLLFCKPFASKRLKAKEVIYKELLAYTRQYTDVLFLIDRIFEIEKLKFVLFNKKQLALFNAIKKPENPLKMDFFHDKEYSKRFKFNLSRSRQEKYYYEAMEVLKEKEKLDKIDERLVKMIDFTGSYIDQQ